MEELQNEQIEIEGKRINPWISMWTKARQVVPYLVKEDRKGLIFLLVWMNGIAVALNYATRKSLGDFHELSYIIGASLARGLIFGFVVWYIVSVLIWLVGKIFKGKATYKEVRRAFAYAQAPLLVTLFISWPLSMMLFGEETFTANQVYLSSPLFELSWALVIFDIAIGIWQLVIMSQAIGAVQKLSSWIGFLIIILTVVIPIVLALLIALMFI